MEQDFRTIHEDGVLSGIMDFMAGTDVGKAITGAFSNILMNQSAKDAAAKVNGFSVNQNIAKSAASLTATFPVIVTEATTLNNAVMISKAIERKAVEMLRMLFAANQITNVTSAQAYLNKFHNNLSNSIDLSGMGVDDVIEYMDSIQESTSSIQEAAINQAIKAVCEDTKNNIHHVLETGLNQVSVQEFKLSGSIDNPTVWLNHDNDDDVFNEFGIAYKNGKATVNKTEYEFDRNGKQKKAKKVSKSTTTTIDNDPHIDDIKSSYEMINKSVLRTDVQKANEAVPSMVVVNFVATGLGGGNNVITTAVIGVKAVLHYVSSEEMVNRIVVKNSDSRTLFNFIRATTREIAFFKDFLFSVNRAKIDAIARSGKGSNSRIWKILELRADKSKMNRTAGTNNTNCAAITSLIISKAEVDLIKKFHRIDLTRPGVLTSIMRGYNFMCTAIVDEIAERVDFMYDDGTSKFETLSFMSLERDAETGAMKKVMTLLATERR